MDGYGSRGDFPAEFVARTWERVERSGPDDCWLWTGTITRWGYGQIAFKGRSLRSNRLVYFFTTGEWPENVCHTCDIRACCNPAHLFAGTSADNQHDKRDKGRAAKGERNGGGRKLTDENVRAIRQLIAEGRTARSIGEQFGVSSTEIGYIKHGRHWSHVA